MGMFGGLVAGAVYGGADAVQDQARKGMEADAKLDFERQRSAIEEARQQRAAELQDRLSRSRAQWEVDTVNGLGKDKVAYEQTLGKVKNEQEVGKERQIAPIRTEQQITAAKGMAQARIDVETAANNDPKFLAGLRKHAAATHIESLASITQAELGRMEIAERKQIATLTNEAIAIQNDSTLTDADREKKLARINATVQTIKGKQAPTKEYDSEKVTTETPDGNGGTIKTEKIVRRNPGGIPEEPKGPPVGTVIKDKRFKGGDPNDKANWEPVKKPDAAPAPAPAAAPAAPERTGVIATNTGLEGLSSITLRRIAGDSTHPLQKQAQAMVAESTKREAEMQSKRIAEPQFDPSQYR